MWEIHPDWQDLGFLRWWGIFFFMDFGTFLKDLGKELL